MRRTVESVFDSPYVLYYAAKRPEDTNEKEEILHVSFSLIEDEELNGSFGSETRKSLITVAGRAEAESIVRKIVHEIRSHTKRR